MRGLVLALVVGCATTTATIEQTWRAPDTAQLTKVVTVFPARDGVLRRTAEDSLARHLAAYGVHAVPGYRVLGDQDLQDRTRATAALRGAGFDGVVAMHVVSAEQHLEYYPSFDYYWGPAWGTVIPYTVIRVQIDAYTVDGQKLLWSALSRSIEPSTFGELVDDVTKVASAELERQRVIPPAPPRGAHPELEAARSSR